MTPALALIPLLLTAAGPAEPTFRAVAPIIEKRCLSCHNSDAHKADLSLESAADLARGGKSGPALTPGDPEHSRLITLISGPYPKMPKKGELTADEVAAFRRWVAAGAPFPADARLEDKSTLDPTWWSFQPITRPAVPPVSPADQAWVRNPIDAFLLAKLRQQNLSPSPEADRRTLIRRLYFDLIGLPPTAEQIDAFVSDPHTDAYEKLVDDLLASPHYGERWARHWLDVVHYGDTHGYDKDKLRPNAWPYRDYVIRSFNDDKPYARFVFEQLAGDTLLLSGDGVIATGFIAAGPFDYVGQIEVKDNTLDKAITRNLDRDDMVATTMNAFVSLTAQCARCHNHKFDPISQADYYSLQAVFAGVDRADRPYDTDATVVDRRAKLTLQRTRLARELNAIDDAVRAKVGDQLAALDRQIADARLSATSAGQSPAYGYHSQIAGSPDEAKWVQVDLGSPRKLKSITLVAAYDTYNNIGAGFGFPLRYRVEISDDPEFKTGVTTIADRTTEDVANPGVTPIAFSGEFRGRFIRVTATRLALRRNDYIFALGELMATDDTGANVARGAAVTSLDSIESGVRWGRKNLVDGLYFGADNPAAAAKLTDFAAKREQLIATAIGVAQRDQRAALESQIKDVDDQLRKLPTPSLVFAAATHFRGQGNFKPTEGKPREIRILKRGSEKNPGELVGPGTIKLADLPDRFEATDDEAARRTALANWITDRRNPLTWRSIVNRVWLYHFGRGIVDSPNDFGRMGMKPTHPELLDYLAAEFRDGRQSLKDLHRLIVTSATFRQSSNTTSGGGIDSGNQYLWRMNPRKLEAEAVRDAVLVVSGQLNPTMFGPGYQDFAIDKPQHSPHYLYEQANLDDPAIHRRSIYRFIVRSVPNPFMESLDCADPSMVVDKRVQTLTALQALTLLNNPFMVHMAGKFSQRLQAASTDLPSAVDAAYRLALGRAPSAAEKQTLVQLAQKHGLPMACRLLFNANEFMFID
jgi:mono/diheme cytochrome c family protein